MDSNIKSIILYGSAIIDYSIAKDIDLMIIREEKESSEIQKIIYEKQKILPKKIHLISLDNEEFSKKIDSGVCFVRIKIIRPICRLKFKIYIDVLNYCSQFLDLN